MESVAGVELYWVCLILVVMTVGAMVVIWRRYRGQRWRVDEVRSGRLDASSVLCPVEPGETLHSSFPETSTYCKRLWLLNLSAGVLFLLVSKKPSCFCRRWRPGHVLLRIQ